MSSTSSTSAVHAGHGSTAPFVESVRAGMHLGDFQCLGQRGVTDPHNSYAHSIAWYRNKLFIGTFRNSLCLMKRDDRTVPPPKMDFWPVYCPNPEDEASFRAQILAYDPAVGTWEKMHDSIMVPEDDRIMPRDLGYRAMGVYQGKSDPHPCLYAGAISKHGCHVLRSVDGYHFEDTHGSLDGVSVRTLCTFRDKFYTAPIGKAGHHGNESFGTYLLETDDPNSGNWWAAGPPGFGDSTNLSLFDIEEFNDHLYVSTMNATSGFQIWKTDAKGKPPYRWKKVMTAGGYRGFLNEFGIKLCKFGECLYVGSGIAGGGYDRVQQVGPGAAEVLRIWPDDGWDLVVGEARMTPDGMKYPTSGMSAGFDNFLNGYMWYMAEHQGWLYISTFNAAAFMPFQPHSLAPNAKEQIDRFVRNSPADTLDEFVERFGGCHLWRTRDGERFYPITRDGFGTACNMGIRRLQSTPHGLFVGTSNPFGPLMGVCKDGEWSYQDNSRGGIEIWLGKTSEPTEHASVVTGRTRTQQVRHSELKVTRHAGLLHRANAFGEQEPQTEFSHVGLWSEGVTSPKQALQALVDELTSLMAARQGPVLDVGVGSGAGTRALLKHFSPRELTGIDELHWAVDTASAKVPSVAFLPMDATRLEFEDESFANVVCLESAPEFDTREAFLKEAFRVLKPGGTLLVADILYSKAAVLARSGKYRTNHLKNPEAYAKLLKRVGFEKKPVIRDVTDRTLPLAQNHLSERLRKDFIEHKIAEKDFNAAMTNLAQLVLFGRYYLIVAATK